MPRVVWREYLRRIPQRDTERQMRAAQVAMLPHLKRDAIRQTYQRWEMTLARFARSVRAQAGEVREWLRKMLGAGISD